MRPVWVSKKPSFIHSGEPATYWGVMQLPLFTYFNGKTIDEVTYQQLCITMKDPSDKKTIKSLVKALKANVSGSYAIQTADDVQKPI